MLHISSCNNINSNEYNKKLYPVIRANSGFENLTIEVIEEYKNCSSLEDARNKEKYWFNKLKANLNSNNPLRTFEEKKEQLKQYHINNSDKVKEQMKQWQINNIDK